MVTVLEGRWTAAQTRHSRHTVASSQCQLQQGPCGEGPEDQSHPGSPLPGTGLEVGFEIACPQTEEGPRPSPPAGNEGPAQNQPGLHGNPARLPKAPTVHAPRWQPGVPGQQQTHVEKLPPSPPAGDQKEVMSGQWKILVPCSEGPEPRALLPPSKDGQVSLSQEDTSPHPISRATEGRDRRITTPTAASVGSCMGQHQGSLFPDRTPRKRQAGLPGQQLQRETSSPAGVVWGSCCPDSPQQKPSDTYACMDTGKSLS